ncbi:MAG: competence/damage-inducible protein A [Bacteroidota bacterium]
MKVYLITIGDEILIGQVTDTNAAFMAQQLSEQGHEIVEKMSVPDSFPGILGGIERAMELADVVLLTGGLGPTKDDITKQVLAQYFESEMVFHEPTWEAIQAIFRRFGREPKDSHRHQCFLPAKAVVLPNERGTAPGMLLEKAGKILISMPGVPYEMRALVRNAVIPELERREDRSEVVVYRTLLTAGEGESWIAARLEKFENGLPGHVKLAYLPHLGTVRLRLTAKGSDAENLNRELDELQAQAESLLGDLVYDYGDISLAESVGNSLKEKGWQLATAESCTGGQIAGKITANAGSSAYFRGSVVAYDNAVKTDLLGVAPAIINRDGAVSEACVRAMAEGVLRTTGAQVSIATSGIAGPGGGTEKKPVGTIWMAVSNGEQTEVQLLKTGKDRRRNIEYTSLRALNMLRLFIRKL